MYIVVNKSEGFIKQFGKLSYLKDFKKITKLSTDDFNNKYYLFFCGNEVFYPHILCGNSTQFNYFNKKNYYGLEDIYLLSKEIKRGNNEKKNN